MKKVYSLRFRDVGRHKATFALMFTGESMDDMPPKVIRDVRTQGGLLSREVELQWDETAGEGQVIVGGMRTVGTFSIIAVEGEA